ncbi:MAG: helix-turn-helix domain-containing protein [Rhizobiales bacterium]|nr:helix-turn-helix domain-containing protein [Hyphomicrobiales bacterium]
MMVPPQPISAGGRLSVLSLEEVRPFAVNLPSPEIGESLLGFATRCFGRTPVRSVVHALTLAGIGKLSPESLPTTLTDPNEIRGLATLLQTTEKEIEKRLYRSGTLDNGKSAAIDFFGTMVRVAYRFPNVRRVSPRALRKSLHHRAIWDLRVFSFDPETKESLLDKCPECKKLLSWTRAYGTHMCEWCRDEDGFAQVDLRDYPQPLVGVDDVEALDFLVELIAPDPDVRREALRKADREMWGIQSCSEMFETIIAFACALIMKSDGTRSTTLERPKRQESYQRFTPEILASAARVVLDGEHGFTVLADRIRRDAKERVGFYGVKKELLPLFCVSLDQHLSEATRKIIRKAIHNDMTGANSSTLTRRNDYARNDGYMGLKPLSAKTGVPPRVLARLADSGLVKIITATAAKRAPKLMNYGDVAPLIEIYNDRVHQKFAAGCLGIDVSILPSLESRKLINRIEGPATGMFEATDTYFRNGEVKELAARIDAAIRPRPAGTQALRLSKAVKRLGMSPIPWGAVISAIVSGKAEIHRVAGDNKTWRTGSGTCNLRQFIAAVQSELIPEDTSVADRWVGNRTAAEMLRVNEATISALASRGHLDRSGPHAHTLYDREQIEEFFRRYIFIPEIVERAKIRRSRDARQWLADRGVEVSLELEPNKYLAFDRVAVEGVI